MPLPFNGFIQPPPPASPTFASVLGGRVDKPQSAPAVKKEEADFTVVDRKNEGDLQRGMRANNKPREELGWTLIVNGRHQASQSFGSHSHQRKGCNYDNKTEDHKNHGWAQAARNIDQEKGLQERL